jgi:hypothetical protein
MNKILLVFICVLCVSCGNKSNCNLDEALLKYNDSIILKAKTKKTFSELLTKIEEAELETFKAETYRLIIVGAWGNIRTYRIINNSEAVTISSKKYWAWDENREMDSLGKTKTKNIRPADWQKIKTSIDSLNFWRLPVVSKKPRLFLDGSFYYIEGYSPKKNECTGRNYHVSSRTSPEDSTLYSIVFSTVIELTLE